MLTPTVAALVDRYQQAPEAAQALIRVGSSPVDGTLPDAQQAAWTMVASLFFNLDEAINK